MGKEDPLSERNKPGETLTKRLQEKQLISIVVNPKSMMDAAAKNEETRQALENLETIKQINPNSVREVTVSERFASRSQNLLKDLNVVLPEPADNVIFEICGAIDSASIFFVYALKTAGYNASFSARASYKGESLPPEFVMRHILEDFHDFFTSRQTLDIIKTYGNL